VPEPLRSLNWIFLRSEDDFAAGVAKLMEALDTDLPWVRQHTRLLVRATEWDTKDRDTGLFLRGKELEAAERWLVDAQSHPSPEPTATQVQFVVESRRADTRRQRIVLASTAAALALSIALAIWALRERSVAQEQTQLSVANNLLVESQSDRHEPQLRILLAVESARRLRAQQRATNETLQVVDAIASLRGRKVGSTRAAEGPIGLAVSARGDRVATWSGSRLVVRRTAGMSGERAWNAGADVTAAAFDATGSRLAVGTGTGVRWLDLASDDQPWTDLDCPGRAVALRLDPVGRFLAAVTEDSGPAQRLCLWSMGDGRRLVQLPSAAAAGEVDHLTLAFSEDSKFFAAAMPDRGGMWRIILLSTSTPGERRTWSLPARPNVAFRGSTLVATDRNAIWGWHAADGREVSRWTMDERWRPLALSPDGRVAIVQIFTGRSWAMDHFSYQQVGLYDAAGGIELAQIPHLPSGFTADGRFLIDGRSLLQIPSLRVSRVIPGPAERFQVLSDDGSLAVTLSADAELSAWLLTDAPAAMTVPLDPKGPTPRAFSTTGALAATASLRDITLLALNDPPSTRQLELPFVVNGLAFSDDGRYLAAVGDGRMILLDLPGLDSRIELSTGWTAPPATPCGLLDAPCRRRAEQTWLRDVEPLFFAHDSRFVVWRGGSVSVWTLPDGRLAYADREARQASAILQQGTDLLIGHRDGRLTMVDTETWKPRLELTSGLGRIDGLIAVPGTNAVAGYTVDAAIDFQGRPQHGSSTWRMSLIGLESGTIIASRDGGGTLGPWSADGSNVAVQSTSENVDIMSVADGTRVRATVELSRSVAQRASPIAFTPDGRHLVVESETPITFGRAEPTLHIVNTQTGRATLRMPARDLTKDSIQLDRGSSYPEQFLADGRSGLVASIVFRNADHYWGLSADRSERRLTVWRISRDGGLTPVFEAHLSANAEPVAFVSDRFVVTAPTFAPEAGELKDYGLMIWAADAEERLRLACHAGDGRLSEEDWTRFIGRFTGEAPRPTCEHRGE
jgi:hypothetical protein